MSENKDAYKDINIGSGATKMGGKHKKEPIHRKFDSPEELAANAEQQYQIGKIKVNQAELDAGFDVRDRESVIAFDIGYTPLSSGVVIKEIPKEIIPEETGLTFVDLSNASTKYWVIQPGLLVSTIKKGDVVALGGSQGGQLQAVNRTFKKVRFVEVAGHDIAGVFLPEKELRQRLQENEFLYHKKEYEYKSGVAFSKSGVDKYLEDKDIVFEKGKDEEG